MIGSNTTVSIYKIAHSSTGSTFSASADVTGLEAFIESQRAELVQALGQQMNVEVFLMHCDPANIDIGDKIIDASSVEYRVAGIEKHENNQDVDDVWTVTLNTESA